MMITVLIADDDAVTRAFVSRVVENLNYSVIQCSNGRTAWEILQDNPSIHLLITDMCMPEVDGKELIQILRGHSRFANFPIIAMSGVVKIEEIRELLEIGATKFLAKPLENEELSSYVKELCESADSLMKHSDNLITH